MAKQSKKRGRPPKAKVQEHIKTQVIVDSQTMEASGQGYDTDADTGNILTGEILADMMPPDVSLKDLDVTVIPLVNDHNVQNGQWAAWTDQQQCMFNDLYSDMICSPSAYNSPPNAPLIELDQWRTIARNAALKAANCV